MNLGYAAVAFGSVAFGRPFVGYVVAGFAGPDGRHWLDDPVRTRQFRNASILWGVLFVLRLVVQVPLYLADAFVILGTAKIAMGLPLFGVGIWLTWLILRTPTRAPEPAAPPG